MGLYERIKKFSDTLPLRATYDMHKECLVASVKVYSFPRLDEFLNILEGSSLSLSFREETVLRALTGQLVRKKYSKFGFRVMCLFWHLGLTLLINGQEPAQRDPQEVHGPEEKYIIGFVSCTSHPHHYLNWSHCCSLSNIEFMLCGEQSAAEKRRIVSFVSEQIWSKFGANFEQF